MKPLKWVSWCSQILNLSLRCRICRVLPDPAVTGQKKVLVHTLRYDFCKEDLTCDTKLEISATLIFLSPNILRDQAVSHYVPLTLIFNLPSTWVAEVQQHHSQGRNCKGKPDERGLPDRRSHIVQVDLIPEAKPYIPHEDPADPVAPNAGKQTDVKVEGGTAFTINQHASKVHPGTAICMRIPKS